MRAVALQLVAIAALAAAGAIAVYAWHPERPPLYFNPHELKEGEVDLAQAQEWAAAGELVWVDARPRKQYEAGHVDGAILLNERDDFNALLMDVWDDLQNSADKYFVIYCGLASCKSSERVAQLLRDLSFPEVYVLNGGVETLRRGGLLK